MFYRKIKSAFIGFIMLFMVIVLLAGCGGGSNTPLSGSVWESEYGCVIEFSRVDVLHRYQSNILPLGTTEQGNSGYFSILEHRDRNVPAILLLYIWTSDYYGATVYEVTALKIDKSDMSEGRLLLSPAGGAENWIAFYLVE